MSRLLILCLSVFGTVFAQSSLPTPLLSFSFDQQQCMNGVFSGDGANSNLKITMQNGATCPQHSTYNNDATGVTPGIGYRSVQSGPVGNIFQGLDRNDTVNSLTVSMWLRAPKAIPNLSWGLVYLSLLEIGTTQNGPYGGFDSIYHLPNYYNYVTNDFVLRSYYLSSYPNEADLEFNSYNSDDYIHDSSSGDYGKYYTRSENGDNGIDDCIQFRKMLYNATFTVSDKTYFIAITPDYEYIPPSTHTQRYVLFYIAETSSNISYSCYVDQTTFPWGVFPVFHMQPNSVIRVGTQMTDFDSPLALMPSPGSVRGFAFYNASLSVNDLTQIFMKGPANSLPVANKTGQLEVVAGGGVLQISQLPFFDADNDPITSIKLMAPFPLYGSLIYQNEILTSATIITSTQWNALMYIPYDPNAVSSSQSGQCITEFDSFNVQITDKPGCITSKCFINNTMRVSVCVRDAPNFNLVNSDVSYSVRDNVTFSLDVLDPLDASSRRILSVDDATQPPTSADYTRMVGGGSSVYWLHASSAAFTGNSSIHFDRIVGTYGTLQTRADVLLNLRPFVAKYVVNQSVPYIPGQHDVFKFWFQDPSGYNHSKSSLTVNRMSPLLASNVQIVVTESNNDFWVPITFVATDLSKSGLPVKVQLQAIVGGALFLNGTECDAGGTFLLNNVTNATFRIPANTFTRLYNKHSPTRPGVTVSCVGQTCYDAVTTTLAGNTLTTQVFIQYFLFTDLIQSDPGFVNVTVNSIKSPGVLHAPSSIYITLDNIALINDILGVRWDDLDNDMYIMALSVEYLEYSGQLPFKLTEWEIDAFNADPFYKNFACDTLAMSCVRMLAATYASNINLFLSRLRVIIGSDAKNGTHHVVVKVYRLSDDTIEMPDLYAISQFDLLATKTITIYRDFAPLPPVSDGWLGYVMFTNVGVTIAALLFFYLCMYQKAFKWGLIALSVVSKVKEIKELKREIDECKQERNKSILSSI